MTNNTVDFEATVRFRRGESDQAMIDSMVADGFPVEDATIALRKVRKRLTAQDRSRGMVYLAGGVLVALPGVFLLVGGWNEGRVSLGGLALLLSGGGGALLGVRQIMTAGKDSALARQAPTF